MISSFLSRITAGENKTEDYLKMNPLGKVALLSSLLTELFYLLTLSNRSLLLTLHFSLKVPVMKDGDFVLTESVAMLRYLSREKQVPVSCLVD